MPSPHLLSTLVCRALQSHATGSKDAKWVPPEKFQRLTRKFWLQPADVIKFKCQLIKHLPVLIFGDRRKMTEGEPCAQRGRATFWDRQHLN